MPVIDVKQNLEDLTELVEIARRATSFILHPGEFVLGSTLERVALPDDLVARLEGKSSLGRLGLLIHSTAGFVDAGWDGHLTLELSNVANLPITLYPGMKIGQISLPPDDHAGRRALRLGRGRARSTRASGARRRAATGRTSAPADPARPDPVQGLSVVGTVVSVVGVLVVVGPTVVVGCAVVVVVRGGPVPDVVVVTWPGAEVGPPPPDSPPWLAEVVVVEDPWCPLGRVVLVTCAPITWWRCRGAGSMSSRRARRAAHGRHRAAGCRQRARAQPVGRAVA